MYYNFEDIITYYFSGVLITHTMYFHHTIKFIIFKNNLFLLNNLNLFVIIIY